MCATVLCYNGTCSMPMTAPFSYEEAFAANRGLLTPDEQQRLRQATVAIPGMGGVGGAHLLALTRLGFERFAIADHDTFELRNFNRQPGATLQTLGQPKTTVMADMARAINPAASIRSFPEGIHANNIDEFLTGCDVVVDGLDFFCMEARRLLFQRAHARRVPAVTCGPMGFSAALLVFMPNGPSFDQFMAIDDSMSAFEQLVRFAVGLAPAALHLPYLDPTSVNLKEHRGPSSSIAINVCAGVVAAEVMNMILKRRAPLGVPRYAQFDPYRLRYRTGTLWGGNRHPWQQLKLWYIRRTFGHGAP